MHEPAPDPLAPARQRLAAVAQEALPLDFAPEARLVLSPALLADEVQGTLEDAARSVEALRFALPFLGEVALRPTVKVLSARADVEPACAGCVALTVEIAGVVSPVGAGGLLPGLRYSGTARGVFALASVPVVDPQGHGFTEVRAVAAAGTDAAGHKGWSASITLEELPIELSQSVSSSVTDFVQRLMESEARPDILLASLPNDGAVRLRGLRPGAHDGAVIVDIAFVAIDAGVVPDGLPPVTSGFALQVPEQTLLALARAETLRMPPQDGYVVDPQRIVVDGEGFALDLAVIKLDRDPTRRDVRVDGTIAIDGADLHITPLHTEQTARLGGFDPLDFLVQAAVLERVESSLRLTVPVAQAAAVGGRTRQARLTSLTDLGDVLQIGGVTDTQPPR